MSRADWRWRRSPPDDTPGLDDTATPGAGKCGTAAIMRRMPGPPTRALHDRLLASLAASPKRDVAGSLPPGRGLDIDSFERRILGAERRLVRVGTVTGRPTAVPDSGQLVLLSCRNIDAYLVAIATLWKRGFIPLLADADLSRAEIADLVRKLRPAFCLLDRRAGPHGGGGEDLGGSLPGLHARVPGRRVAAETGAGGAAPPRGGGGPGAGGAA